MFIALFIVAAAAAAAGQGYLEALELYLRAVASLDGATVSKIATIHEMPYVLSWKILRWETPQPAEDLGTIYHSALARAAISSVNAEPVLAQLDAACSLPDIAARGTSCDDADTLRNEIKKQDEWGIFLERYARSCSLSLGRDIERGHIREERSAILDVTFQSKAGSQIVKKQRAVLARWKGSGRVGRWIIESLSDP